MPVSGTIRNDSSGAPYLEIPPNDNVVHIAYQNFDIGDIGTKYTGLFSTEEKHMVSGINKLFVTRYQWDDLVGDTIEFFTPNSAEPYTSLRFEKIGEYYTANIVPAVGLLPNYIRPVDDIYQSLETTLTSGNAIYHGKESDGSDLRLIKFTKLSFTTHPLSSSAMRQEDFTLLLVGNDKLVTTKLNTYPLGMSDTYTVLEFEKKYMQVVELVVDVPTRSSFAKAISHATGLKVTPDNFVTNELVRVFNPDQFEYANEELTIHTLHSGDNVKFVLAGWSYLDNDGPVSD